MRLSQNEIDLEGNYLNPLASKRPVRGTALLKQSGPQKKCEPGTICIFKAQLINALDKIFDFLFRPVSSKSDVSQQHGKRFIAVRHILSCIQLSQDIGLSSDS